MDFKALTEAWVLAHASPAAFTQLERFVQHVLQAAQNFNLTAWDEAALWEKGVFTSLTGLYHALNKGLDGHLADVGAGAGFPSVPYHIVFPQTRVTLIEATQKRSDFLQMVKQELGLHYQVLQARAETLPGEQFDVVTAMAVAPLKQLISLTYHLGRLGAQFVFFKGVNVPQEILAATPILQPLNIQVSLATPSALELGGRLVLVSFVKTVPMPLTNFF